MGFECFFSGWFSGICFYFCNSEGFWDGEKDGDNDRCGKDD